MAKKKSAASFFEGAEIVYLGWIMAGLVKGYAAAAKHSHSCEKESKIGSIGGIKDELYSDHKRKY